MSANAVLIDLKTYREDMLFLDYIVQAATYHKRPYFHRSLIHSAASSMEAGPAETPEMPLKTG
jgi:hypothetical protein